MSTVIEVYEELRAGGDWLAAARRWMQSNVRNGDTLTWGSREPVQVAFGDLERLALAAASAAVAADRKKRANNAHVQRRIYASVATDC
jgi:hypothetical protein